MTPEEIRLKKWLQRAFYADKKIKSLDMLLKTFRTHAEGLDGTRQYKHTGRSDTRLNGTETAFIAIADIERKYSQQKSELLKLRKDISEAISLLQDDELETVLIHRYLLFHTIEQTAEIMNCSPETVKRKQRKAIEKLTRYDLV